MANTTTIWTSGGRKTSTARIKLSPGKGTLTINDRSLEEYFPLKDDQVRLFEPFKTVDLEAGTFDVSLKVAGGGKKGQLDACRHAITRGLEKYNPDLRTKLKSAGLLTRDPRAKERKKYGLRKARRAPQFSKR
ncbi:30S ribosomal protein S9 [Patescibacteria group bacterium]|nr:30S ribosomal protein S9 [Patescibacteria group bacterium]